MNDPTVTQLGTMTGPGAGQPVFAIEGDHTCTVTVMGNGSVSASVNWQGSNDGIGWVTLSTINPSGTTSATAKGSTSETYRFWRIAVAVLTGAWVSASVASESGSSTVLQIAPSGSALPPAAPSAVLAAARNGAIVVQWVAAPGVLPDSLTISASTGQTITVPCTGRRQEALLPGLANGVAVTARVAATLNGLTGAQSASSNSVVPNDLASTVLPVTRGLEFWWSAGQVSGLSNGQALASMIDISGNGYNAAGQGGGGTWVSAWSNGKPAVALNGTSQYYHTLATALYGGMRKPDFTVYALFSVAGTATAAGRVLSLERGVPTADPSGCFAVGISAGGGGGTAIVQGFNNGTPFASASFATGDITNNTPIRVVATGPGAMRVNGGAVSGSFFDGRRAFGAGAPWSIGAMYGGGYGKYSNVAIAEVVIFSEVHKASEIAAMETYLSTRA